MIAFCLANHFDYEITENVIISNSPKMTCFIQPTAQNTDIQFIVKTSIKSSHLRRWNKLISSIFAQKRTTKINLKSKWSAIMSLPLVFLRRQIEMRLSLSAVPAEDAVDWLCVLTFPRAGFCVGDVGGACVLQPF